jgi:hypothetical protein
MATKSTFLSRSSDFSSQKAVYHASSLAKIILHREEVIVFFRLVTSSLYTVSESSEALTAARITYAPT